MASRLGLAKYRYKVTNVYYFIFISETIFLLLGTAQFVARSLSCQLKCKHFNRGISE